MRFYRGKWTILPIFQLIQQRGNVTPDEMYRLFNMGIGMTVVRSPDNASRVTQALPEARIIGEVVAQKGGPRVVF